jgi:hypothetical protein
MTLLGLYRGIEGHPLLRSIQLGAEVGQAVGQYAGEQTAARIEAKGAATGPVFTKEMFEYEISAIRMGAQI